MHRARIVPLIASALLLSGNACAAGIVVGSKIFTEGYILGEIAAQVIEASAPGVPVGRKLGMGSTGIVFTALTSGAIDLYADYTGTLAEAIIKNPQLRSEAQIRAALEAMGLVMSAPLGFNNTYAIATREDFAVQHGLHTISDLARLPSLRAGFSYEFVERRDGYPGMAERYHLALNPQHINRMEHSLAYQAIEQRAVDVIDIYSTDAKIRKFKLRVLKDDLGYFPSYQAVWVARASFVQHYPHQWLALQRLEGAIDESHMLDMNARADIDHRSFAQIAAEFLGVRARPADTLLTQISRRTVEHLWLVGLALLFSITVGVPLGVAAARYHAAGRLILVLSGVIQTVPSLALLCFLIPLFGVGTKPALVALCLYSLLPVVQNTFTGIRAVDRKHLENARAFGLTPRQILLRITLPLASPMLLAGIKTATIVSIGTATLAALVGAGGYGAPIVSGLALNDFPTILTGAIPAALMALLAQGLFELAGKVLIPAGLRGRT